MSLFLGVSMPERKMEKWKEETNQKQSGLQPLLDAYSVWTRVLVVTVFPKRSVCLWDICCTLRLDLNEGLLFQKLWN